MKRWTFLIGLILPMVLMAAISWYDDPFGMIGRRAIRPDQARAAHAFAIRRAKRKTIILGSSRIGLIPGSRTIWDDPPLKINIPGVTIHEIRYYLEHAYAVEPLQKVVIEISYPSFIHSVPNDFNTERLLSVSDSKNMWRYRMSIVKDLYATLLSQQSCRLELLDLFSKNKKLQQALEQEIISTNTALHFPQENTETMGMKQENPLSDLEAIIEFVNSYNIEAYFFIAPVHATHENYLSAIYGFENTELWKRELVALFEREAEKTGKRFPLWDFSGFNSITTESLPQDGKFTRMKYFIDKSHFSTTVGKMILDRIFDTCQEPCNIPADFGIQLTSENVEHYLSGSRAIRQQYNQAQQSANENASTDSTLDD